MNKINKALQAGHAAFLRGEFANARRQLRNINHPKVLHLLALVEKADGNLDTAEQLLQRAAAKQPRDPEIANNLGKLACDSGQNQLAETELRRALDLRPDFLQAALTLGQLLVDQERYQEALNVYKNISVAHRDDTFVRYGLATAELGLGHAERAEAIFEALPPQDQDRPQVLFMRGRCRLELGKTLNALRDLKASHAKDPNVLTLKALANTYWMTRDLAAFEALLDDALKRPALAVMAAELYRQSGSPEKALTALNNCAKSMSLPAESWGIAASAYIDLEQAEDAEVMARESLGALPDDSLAKSNLIVSLLMQGRADEAMPLVRELRESEPHNQQWIAYEASALRLLDTDRYARLVDLERFVRPYELPVPDGFDSIEDFNAAFLEALQFLHSDQTHPLNQSLREGSQTPRDLTCVDDPVIQAFYRALDGPIRQYMEDIGSAKDHPLTARNTGNYSLAGGWSVKLDGEGRHVNHVHPEGWISSSYYVLVPAEVDTDAGKAGWIKFAEPPFKTSPPSPPQKWVQPHAGMLVLFPSFLWHGTQPIRDGSIRVTAPFDAVPA